MKARAFVLGSVMMLVLGFSPVLATVVMVQDFETAASPPKVWVVNIPNENASTAWSTDVVHEGKRSLKLHYHFVQEGDFQYLGIPIPVNIHAPIHTLRFWLKGDNSKCSYGIRIIDAGGETHQYSKNTGQGGIIDFNNWRQVVFNLDSDHETWGGDENKKIDYPIRQIILTIGQPVENGKRLAVESDLYFDAIRVHSEKSILETLGGRVSVTSPAYGADINGDTPIVISAPGFRYITATCRKPGGKFGIGATVARITLDGDGKGSFVFGADDYPHGPITLTLSANAGDYKDNCYLQLYNTGGISWNEGLGADPPAAEGMTLVFADDFDGPLSISGTDPNATYYDHKPPNGWQDFSTLPFTSFEKPNNPFRQVDTYLRIRASETAQSAGLISSMKNDASGITAKAPCYFECRFIGPNAPGTWPAFWLMTDYMTEFVKGSSNVPCDELDIIEAYGGEGPRHPNAYDSYMITPHCWEQGEEGKALEKKAFENLNNPIRMGRYGIPSSWYEAFHTYGCKITKTETIYYCDDIEVGRHETLPLSKEQPFFFMINLATGGGWPVDLSRYNGQADMYVDYVRVYSGQ